MGDSGTTKKFRRLLKQSYGGYVFKGVIERIEPADYAPRLTRKILVRTTHGQKRVNFTNPSIFSSNLVAGETFLDNLKIGQIVTILGELHKKDESSTAPKIVLLPEQRLVLLTKEHRDYRDIPSKLQIFIGFFASIFLIISQVNSNLEQSALGIAMLLLAAFLGLYLYIDYSMREIVLHCDQSMWESFTLEIMNRFEKEVYG